MPWGHADRQGWAGQTQGSEGRLARTPVPPAPLPFCHVMAGRGAPEVSQLRITDMPSITVLSWGPLVMLGAMPAGQRDAQPSLKPLPVPSLEVTHFWGMGESSTHGRVSWCP